MPRTSVRRTASHRPAKRRRKFKHDDNTACDLFCVDEHTEILTTAGWKRYDQLAAGDIALTIRPDGSAAEWQPVEAVNVFPAGHRKMQLIEGRGMSALTTDNHRWLSNYRATTPAGRSYRWRIVRSDKLTCDDRIPMSAPVANLPTAPTVPDALVELVAWYWTEGTDRASGRVHIVQDHTVNPQHVAAIRSALVEAFGPERAKRKLPGGPLWAENQSGTQTTFGLNRAAAAALREAAPGKVPSIGWLATLTQPQLDLFIQRSLHADGHERVRSTGRTERVLNQGDQARASAFQAACLIAGHAASMKRHESTYRHGAAVRLVESWAVNVGMRQFVKPLRQKRVQWVEHDGIVWCPTTPNGTWLARRNGTAYFTGNSGFGGLTWGIEQAGFLTIMAANHNEYKLSVHEENFKHAEHWIADLANPDSSDYHDVRDLPAADLLAAGVTCFAAGTLVLARLGLIPIEQVKVGDEVWTHRSRWRKVTHTSAAARPTVTVNATTAITCTPDHPFWAADAQRIYQRRRKYQALAGARCLECGGPAPQFKATNTARLFCSRECRWTNANRRALPVLGTPREVRADSLAGMWVGTPVLGHDGAELPDIDGVGAVTPGLARVLGRWAGDGWVSRRPERGGVWSRVTICASHAESDDLAGQLAHLTDLPWNRTRLRTTDIFHVNRVGLASFIAGNFGHGAAGKRIPAWMLFAPEEVRQAFVDGYVSADGHVSRDGLRLQTSSVSKELAVGMRLLLTSLGYYASVHYGRRAEHAVIEGRTIRQQPQWTVTAHKCRDRRPKHRDADGYRWGKASGAVKPGETVTVYNMTVDEDHTYVADGVVVHNCTNHTHANSVRAYEEGLTLFGLEDPEYQARVTRSERDRATANCVLHYAQRHHPRLLLIECTTEIQSWGPAIPGKKKVGDGSTYRWWIKQLVNEGYRYKVLYLNSMFFGVPQSRDRWYGVFWDRRLPTPDLEHRPPSWCSRCERMVDAVWTWKTGIPLTGQVRYGQQYNYRCPSCRAEVIPPMTPSLHALDLTNLGTRIGDRETPMAASSMARAERCRQRFAEFPAIVVPGDPAGHFPMTGAVFAGHRHNGDGQHFTRPMDTVTSTHEKAVLLAALDNYQGSPRGVDEPLPTQVGSETLGVLTARVLPMRTHGTSRSLGEPMETLVGGAGSGGLGILSTGLLAARVLPNRENGTSRSLGEPTETLVGNAGGGGLGILSTGVQYVTAAGTIKHNGSIDEAQYRAHPLSAPLGTVVGSGNHQGVLFSGWYKQNGSTGTETAPHPLSDPFGTLTARDTTALLFADWQAALAELKLEDCYYRMMAPHEVGRGCGFDVSVPGYGYQGDFIVWGSARDQVDGYGNAVSPPVGAWIGTRLRAILDTPEAVG
jgi:site-specific DNA-cytosine methylase